MFPGSHTLGKPPAFVSCHICGQKFGKQSMKFHVPQCEKKFEAQQLQLPKHLRKSLPSPIDSRLNGDNFTKMSNAEIEKYNAITDDQYNNKVLVKCSKCGRTFFPESLMKHEPVCSAKPVNAKKGESSLASSSQSSLTSTLSPPTNKSKAVSPRTFSIDDSEGPQYEQPQRATPVKKLESSKKLTSKKKSSSAPIQIQVTGVIPVRVQMHGKGEDPQDFLSVSIIKEYGCQMEGEGPDEDGKYTLSGYYSNEEEPENTILLYESPHWPRNEFSITFSLSSKFETLPLEEVEKEQTDSTLTLFFPVSQKSNVTRKKIQL